MWPGSCDTLWRTHICLHYRVIYPWTTWQRWAAARPQTWQPCPWTICRWVRWTKPPCWQWSERRYRAPPPTTTTTLSASHDGRWVERFTWAFCLVSVLAWCYQIITKEIEVNEWKRKYEECRVEVTEMRLGQRDVFTRVLQSEIQLKNVNKCHQFVWENFFIPLADRKIVAEYERTVAQMIGELAPPAGSMLYVF